MNKKMKEVQKQEVMEKTREIKEKNMIQNRMSNQKGKMALLLRMIILNKKEVKKIMRRNKIKKILK